MLDLETKTLNWTTIQKNVAHLWPLTLQKLSVAETGTLPLIILSLEFKCDIKVFHGNLSKPFFEKKVRGQKHPTDADKCRNSNL